MRDITEREEFEITEIIEKASREILVKMMVTLAHKECPYDDIFGMVFSETALRYNLTEGQAQLKPILDNIGDLLSKNGEGDARKRIMPLIDEVHRYKTLEDYQAQTTGQESAIIIQVGDDCDRAEILTAMSRGYSEGYHIWLKGNELVMVKSDTKKPKKQIGKRDESKQQQKHG